MGIKLAIIGIVVLLLIGLYSAFTLRIVDKNKSDNYYFNLFKTKLYYVPMGNSFELGKTELSGLDIKTVKVLDRNYIKDKSAVYFKDIKIQVADAASFKVLSIGKRSFAKDKNRVYFESNYFKDIDANSLKLEGDTLWPIVKDKNNVYSTYAVDYNNNNAIIFPIQNTSAEKYQCLNEFYGKDDKTVYYKGKPITGADAETFILLKDYAKDKKLVYYQGLEVKNLDATTFILIDGGGYAKDKNGVYFGLDEVDGTNNQPVNYVGRLVFEADPETFEMIKGEKIDYAKDKKNHYWGGKIQK